MPPFTAICEPVRTEQHQPFTEFFPGNGKLTLADSFFSYTMLPL